MRIRAAILALLTLASLCGCGARMIPPASPADPVTIYVTDYGRHSSVLFPGDEPKQLVEFAFGDWDFFAREQKDAFTMMRIIVWSRGSALGRRFVEADDPNDLRTMLGCESIVSMQVERDKANAVRDRINQRYESRRDTEIYGEKSRLFFVRDDRHWNLCHNCNHVTAQWLREMDVRIEGWPVTSRLTLGEARAPDAPRSSTAPADAGESPPDRQSSLPQTRGRPAWTANLQAARHMSAAQ
jgi:predicted small lipoprotein YifL